MEIKKQDGFIVAEAMDSDPWVVTPDTKIAEALNQLFQQQKEILVVADKSGVVRGALEIRDLLLAPYSTKKPKTVGDLLSPQSLIVSSLSSLTQALEELKQRGLTSAAVVDSNSLKGQLRLSSIGLRWSEIMAKKDKEINDLNLEIESKDEYLGLVSHDMRAPLTVISLSTDFLLAEDSVKTLSPDQKSFVERIRRNGETASSMIHDILDVVRLDRGFRLDYQKVLFSALLSECAQNLEVIAARKKITLNITHDQEIQVNLDSKRIRQVIENLVLNAIKFSPEGGQVFLRACLAQRPDGSYLALQVRDQGKGVRKEDEAKIFEAFVQTGRPKTPGEAGVGLGLAIVRKFVEFHHGHIEMDGGWQKGVSITVLLPGATLVSGAPEVSVSPQGPVILLVEDDESIREFYKQSLDQYHYHVLEAGDGSEGFSLFQQNKVDLVLSDIRMPKMDGLELLARVRMTGSEVPVILCSGYYVGLENDLGRSDHKPDRVIDKPFKVKDMVEAIEEQLRRYKQAS